MIQGVIIGYDHRKHLDLSSVGFARVAAKVFLSQGFTVYLLEHLVHTPQVPFGVQHFGCAAGMMVTASHNPKADNGFKVYWSNGAQIIPPHDAGIAAAILDNLQPWLDYASVDVLTHPLAKDISEEVGNAYFAALAKLASRPREVNASSPLKVAYTAMHGVGKKWMIRGFEEFGHPPFHVVESQGEPDPQFPTVPFPNPEEKGALNQAQAFANANDCTLILANDPDADRLAAAERLPNTEGPSAAPVWHVFTGNELGVLLGYWTILRWQQRKTEGSRAAVLASIVSSRMLRAIARAEGVLYEDTLTGFKWLGNRAQALRADGIDVLFTYEEALGYCVGDMLSDKDGVTAASVLMEMASILAAGWSDPFAAITNPPIYTVYELLQYLYKKYGLFVSYNSYVISRNPKVTDTIFANLRSSGPTGGYWTHAVGQKILSIQDVTKGYDSTAADLKSILPLTPDSHMIMFEFENGVSVTLRTSGTEPKIKYYTEIRGAAGNIDHLRQELVTFVDALVEEMLQPAVYGLQKS